MDVRMNDGKISHGYYTHFFFVLTKSRSQLYAKNNFHSCRIVSHKTNKLPEGDWERKIRLALEI
jgi:hypothetical protein